MPDEQNNEKLEREIELLFEAAKREKYVHSRSGKIFDSIAGFWFLGEAFESTLAEISRSYIVSSFLLKSLELIYQRIRSDYELPDFSADALTNEDALEKFLQAVGKLSCHESFVRWLQDSLLPECVKLLRVRVQNIEDVSKLGNLADSIQRVTEQYSSGEDGNTWAYDGIFQLSNEFLGISSESVAVEQLLIPQTFSPNASAVIYGSIVMPGDIKIYDAQNEIVSSEIIGREATNNDVIRLVA